MPPCAACTPVLDCLKLVQAQLRRPRLGGIAKPALSGALALLLVIAATLSACHALHQSLHQSDRSGEHLCLACSLASGHLSTASAFFLVPLALFGFAYALTGHETLLPASFDYRLSRSRAPPAR